MLWEYLPSGLWGIWLGESVFTPLIPLFAACFDVSADRIWIAAVERQKRRPGYCARRSTGSG